MIALAGALALVAGCGTPSADLFVVTRDGESPGAELTLLVTDGGGARCNGAPARPIGSAGLIEARALARQLIPEATRGLALPSAAGSQLRYRVRLAAGTVTFSDNSPGRSKLLSRIAALTRDIAIRVCRLRR